MKKTKVEKKNSNDEMMIDLPSGVFDYLGVLFIGFAVQIMLHPGWEQI